MYTVKETFLIFLSCVNFLLIQTQFKPKLHAHLLAQNVYTRLALDWRVGMQEDQNGLRRMDQQGAKKLGRLGREGQHSYACR